MASRRFVLIAAVGVALALPARAHAADHAVLIVSPTKLAAHPAWSLQGRIVDSSYGGSEIFGVNLARTFLKGRAQELHAFTAASPGSLTFDGSRGRWKAALGVTGRNNVVSVNMEIAVTGAALPVVESQQCRGAFVQVPVALRGTFVLRTGTRFFKTLRRTSLKGTVVFNQGGPVDCTPQPASGCASSRSLSVFRTGPGATGTGVQMGTADDGWLSLAFGERRGTATWYHVMFVYGFTPFSGELPTIRARIAAKLPVQGSGTFMAGTTSTGTEGACQTVTATGSFTGSFRTRFTGWGARTLGLSAADGAGYRESR
jgi:hypothetical protein